MLFLLSLALAPAVAAEPAALPERLDTALDRVDATADQRERITALVAEVRERREAWREEGRSLRAELRGLLLADELDPKAVEDVRREFVALVDESSRVVVRHLVEVAQVLTPAQRATLRSHLPAADAAPAR